MDFPRRPCMDGLPAAGISAAMQRCRPRSLLWTQSFRAPGAAYEEAIRSLAPASFGWRFVLETPDSQSQIEAEEEESSPSLERAALLAVVRGLEALDQPSTVSLYTSSRFVMAGLRHGMVEWRTTNWHWEWFGRWAPVAHQDLWRRVETAMRFHDLEPRWWSGVESRSGSRRVIRMDYDEPLKAPYTKQQGVPAMSRESRAKARAAVALMSDSRDALFPRYDGFDF